MNKCHRAGSQGIQFRDDDDDIKLKTADIHSSTIFGHIDFIQIPGRNPILISN